MFSLIFGRKIRLQCPYCLTEILIPREEVNCTTPGCGRELPRQYKNDYQNALPFFVPLVGWPNVGKTVFIQALTLVVERLDRVWPEFHYFPLTQFTLETQRLVRAAIDKNQLPPPTPMGIKDAFMMQMKNMERWGSRTLVIRDCAGENFGDFEFHVDQAQFVIGARTIFFMISLSDLDGASGREEQLLSMNDLMHSYVSTLQRHDVDPRRHRRNVVVILSKADQIAGLPDHLRAYLNDDPIWAAIGPGTTAGPRATPTMHAYFERLERVSAEIGDWLAHQGIGITLMRLAKDMKMHLRFALVSSTGGRVDPRGNGMLEQRWQPFRVLDPFLLALEFESR